MLQTNTFWKRIRAVCVSLVIGAGITPLAVAAVHADTTTSSLPSIKSGVCIPLKLRVAPAKGQSYSWTVSATYCQPKHWAQGQHAIDILTPGATYNGTYWNWSQDPSLYSYVNKTLAAGRATLDYDRIGSGQSSHPLSTNITITSDAYVLHQLIQYAHLAGYKQINSIGHSYGSGIALREAATYNDETRLVLTGYLHAGRNPLVVAALYPANQDPAFADENLDSGYLTTKPGGRASAFYDTATADPKVIAYDEAHKDLVSATGFGGFIADRSVPASTNISNQITEPVLLVVGQEDAVNCFDPTTLDCSNQGAVQSHEAPYFSKAQRLNITLIPNTGHDLTLHPSANQSFATINSWIEAK